MYKNILIPVALDEDQPVVASLAIARELLDDGGRITAIHVIAYVPGYAAQYLPPDHAEARLQEMRDALKAAVGDDVESVVISGHPGRAIVDWATDHGIDCIVIASHRPGLQDYFLGSTAARVVRHSACSVHVLR